jgi:DNA modification methylase
MSVEIIQGDALALPLDDASVDLIVTSPPYFGLRSYQDGGEHYDGQIGDEATPAEFVDALIAATREMVRVLKPSGSIWVNLGDKYAGSKTAGSGAKRRTAVGTPPKSLIGVPWRYALRCIDDLGLILRAEVIWSKPNGLPESVTDRVRRSHETWFHFTKQPRYFSAVDEIREPAQTDRPQRRRALELAERHGLTDAHRDALRARGLGDTGRSAAVQSGTGRNTAQVERLAAEADAALGGYAREFTMTSQDNPLGKLPGSVWTIPTQPLIVPDELGVDHFAAFPMEWPRRIIRGWSPEGICVECRQGRRPVTRTEPMQWKPSARLEAMREQNPDGLRPTSGTMVSPARHTITGYACGCDEPTADTTPAVVLDPFGGTGTTALVAHALGRHGISVDLSSDYCRLARWRTTDPGEIARARLQPKPKPVPTNQEVLW